MQLIRLSYDSGTEPTGEQGDYYDPLFTYKEGDEASYFVISEDSEGDVAGVGPSGVGASKESPTALSSRGWFTEPSASVGEPDVPPTTAKVSSMGLDGISATVEGILGETVAEAVEAVSPLGNTLVSCKQFL